MKLLRLNITRSQVQPRVQEDKKLEQMAELTARVNSKYSGVLDISDVEPSVENNIIPIEDRSRAEKIKLLVKLNPGSDVPQKTIDVLAELEAKGYGAAQLEIRGRGRDEVITDVSDFLANPGSIESIVENNQVQEETSAQVSDTGVFKLSSVEDLQNLSQSELDQITTLDIQENIIEISEALTSGDIKVPTNIQKLKFALKGEESKITEMKTALDNIAYEISTQLGAEGSGRNKGDQVKFIADFKDIDFSMAFAKQHPSIIGTKDAAGTINALSAMKPSIKLKRTENINAILDKALADIEPIASPAELDSLIPGSIYSADNNGRDNYTEVIDALADRMGAETKLKAETLKSRIESKSHEDEVKHSAVTQAEEAPTPSPYYSKEKSALRKPVTKSARPVDSIPYDDKESKEYYIDYLKESLGLPNNLDKHKPPQNLDKILTSFERITSIYVDGDCDISLSSDELKNLTNIIDRMSQEKNLLLKDVSIDADGWVRISLTKDSNVLPEGSFEAPSELSLDDVVEASEIIDYEAARQELEQSGDLKAYLEATGNETITEQVVDHPELLSIIISKLAERVDGRVKDRLTSLAASLNGSSDREDRINSLIREFVSTRAISGKNGNFKENKTITDFKTLKELKDNLTERSSISFRHFVNSFFLEDRKVKNNTLEGLRREQAIILIEDALGIEVEEFEARRDEFLETRMRNLQKKEMAKEIKVTSPNEIASSLKMASEIDGPINLDFSQLKSSDLNRNHSFVQALIHNSNIENLTIVLPRDFAFDPKTADYLDIGTKGLNQAVQVLNRATL